MRRLMISSVAAGCMAMCSPVGAQPLKIDSGFTKASQPVEQVRFGGGGGHYGGARFGGGGFGGRGFGGRGFGGRGFAGRGFVGGRGYGGRGYYGGGGYYGGYGYGLGGLAAGALIGSAIASSPYYYSRGYEDDYYPATTYHYGGENSDYCVRRFRSYDPASGTYLGNDGRRHPCG